MNEEERIKVIDFISNSKSTIIVSIDEDGYPRPVPVFKVKSEGFEIWYATRKNSQKVRDFYHDTKSGMCFINDRDCVALRGDIILISDNDEKSALWKPMFERLFPAGPTDPNLVFVKFTGKEATTFFDGKLNHHRV